MSDQNRLSSAYSVKSNNSQTKKKIEVQKIQKDDVIQTLSKKGGKQENETKNYLLLNYFSIHLCTSIVLC